MLKKILHFNRGQRIGIYIFLLLIAFLQVAFWLLPNYFRPKSEVVDTGFLEEAAKFRESLVEIERKKQSKYEDFDNFYKPYPKKTFENAKYELFAFDPNTSDSAAFVRLGLKPYVAKNIVKYRDKGGKFRKPEDFARVYGITPEKFEELKPYISLETNAENPADNPAQTVNAEKVPEETNLKSIVSLELNSADTAALVRVPGLGRSTAKSIAGYRRMLGGFHSVEQLNEVYGMRPENFEKMKSHFTVDDSQIKKINVNIASLDRLKSHPYIKTFQKAKAIYEFRRKKVKLTNINELKVLDELTVEDLSKLEPYLEFE